MGTKAGVAAIPIEYGEVLRKNSTWFACRAIRLCGRWIPDASGDTLMYFASECQMVAFLKGFHRKGIRVDSLDLAAARIRWLLDDSRFDEDAF